MEDELDFHEKWFLDQQGLLPADVYDGRGLSAKDRHSFAKRAGKDLVLRDPSRSKCGHRLITRHGHCVQCNPSNIAYLQRNSAPAFLYITGSRRSGLIKVGVAQDTNERLKTLNDQSYAGCSDWVMLFYVQFERAGAVEEATQSLLSNYQSEREYEKEGRIRSSKETFNCRFREALDAMAHAAQSLRLQPQNSAWKSRHADDF